MIRSLGLTLSLVLAACATREAPTSAAPAEQQTAGEVELLAVMDAYMREISANDLAAMDARQTAEGMTYRFSPRPDGGWDVVARSNAYWVAPERADDRTYRERYWSPTVLIRGGMGLVWAPYEFWIDGEFSHCGIDSVQLANVDGEWKIANWMWTVEKVDCPTDPSRDKSPNPDDWYQNQYAPLWMEKPWDSVAQVVAFYDATIFLHSGDEAATATPSRQWLASQIAGWQADGWLGSAVAEYQSDRLNPTTVTFKVKWRDWYADGHEEYSCGWYLADLANGGWAFTQYADVDCAAHGM